jgi:hypothetical protein
MRTDLTKQINFQGIGIFNTILAWPSLLVIADKTNRKKIV